VAKNMTDRKKNAGRGQAAAIKGRSGEQVRTVPKAKPGNNEQVQALSSAKKGDSEQVQAVPSAKAPASEERREQAKSVKTPVREERREPARPESKTMVRRETRQSSTFATRLRNNSFGRFMYDAYYELRHKVTWPTFREARNMTAVVIALSLVIGGILALADYGLHRLFLLIIGAK